MKISNSYKGINSYSYFVLGFVILVFLVFMESVFYWVVLVILFDMLIIEGLILKNKYIFWLVFSICKSINVVIFISIKKFFVFINLKIEKIFGMYLN